MPDLAYAVLGRGYWAGRMQKILQDFGRRTVCIGESRRRMEESDSHYKQRLAGSFARSGAQIAWLCVTPGPHIPAILEAATDAGMHAVLEKPWMCPRSLTEPLILRAQSCRLRVAVHYELCFLEGVRCWRRDFSARSGLCFGGRFVLGRPNHTGMRPVDNLGCHLLSIREYAVPQAAVSEIRCADEGVAERRVWLESENVPLASLDFLANREPVIQRFVAAFEAALDAGNFPFDLSFGLRVYEAVEAVKQSAASAS
jgi:hypothetical protein